MASKSYHHGNLAEALVESAMALLGQDDGESITLRAVARQTGVSHAAPYAHFKDLEELIAAIKDRGFDLLDKHLNAVPLPKGKTDAAVRNLARAYIDFALTHPKLFAMMFHRPLKGTPPIGSTYIAQGANLFHHSLAKLQAESKLSEHRIKTIWIAVHGLASLWIGGSLGVVSGDNEEQEFQDLMDQLLI